MASLIGNPRLHKRARWLLAGFYTLLAFGGITMIYPFWIMLSGSISSGFDFKERALIPRYLIDRDELFLKFVTRRYSDLKFLCHVYGIDGVLRPSDLRGRLAAPDHAPSPVLIADWREFLTTAARPGYLAVANEERVTALYQGYLAKRFETDAPVDFPPALWDSLSPIERMNRLYHQTEQTFAFVELPRWKLGQKVQGPIHNDYAAFLKTLSAEHLIPISQGFAGAAWPESLISDGVRLSPEHDWAAFLRAKYESDTALAAAWSDPHATLAMGTGAELPYRAEDAFEFVGHESALRWQMVSENYARVLKFIFQRGKAFQNTVILVVTSILVALLLNPLAAYGLSRYPGRHGRMALLIMILTIAFPAEVAMIPSFLLLRDLDLLNTFAALILPGAVSGFSIFLLKGFFDGLPEELFESATIDGASEIEVFWHIVLPLSRPILAVIALGTFTAAYGGYMWALLVCQEPEMWTLMVWLFQFQINNAETPWLGMAAFAIASIPMLLVFLCCQRLILRGIVIPTEK